MGRFALGTVAALAALLAACNMLNGVGDLSAAEGEVDEAPVRTPRTDAGSSGSSGDPSRGHDVPVDPDDPDAEAASTPVGGDAGVDADTDASTLVPAFDDAFARPNGALGNGWLEHTAGSFALVDGAAQQNATGDYRDLFVQRPASENVRDVLVQATITFADPDGDPTLYARLRRDASGFYGYSVYPDGPGDLYVSRDDGDRVIDVGTKAISPALAVGSAYRLTLRVSGTSPVTLDGSIAKLDGTVLATIHASDTSAKKITSAGSVGFGSGSNTNGRIDDFHRSAP